MFMVTNFALVDFAKQFIGNLSDVYTPLRYIPINMMQETSEIN